jgi:hypothetical protein
MGSGALIPIASKEMGIISSKNVGISTMEDRVI